MRSHRGPWFATVILCLVLAGTAQAQESVTTNTPPDTEAINAFWYYDDVDAAWAFYKDLLGFETVVDYGFAKIMRIAESSYLTVVDASAGMHKTDEPRTVLLTLMTDQLDAWQKHVSEKSIPMPDVDTSDDEFVVSDPQGYLLRFKKTDTGDGENLARPIRVGNDRSIHSSMYSLYFNNIEQARGFYEGLFGSMPVESSSAGSRYRISSSGYIELVDGGDRWHEATAENSVTIAFFTSDVDGWFSRAGNWSGFELRTPEVLNESDLVNVFVGYDPEGYFLEWDTFVDRPENSKLLNYLRQ